jgi:hypothetical protein
MRLANTNQLDLSGIVDIEIENCDEDVVLPGFEVRQRLRDVLGLQHISPPSIPRDRDT